MISYLLAGPAQEPVTLAEAKAFLRLDGTAEDGLVTTLIAAARVHLESVTGRALLQQSWRAVLDDWPADGVIRLPVGPLVSLDAVTAFDDDGEAHELEPAKFLTEIGVVPARVFVPHTIDGMPVLRARLGLELDYLAGHGEDPGDVPADLRQALLALVAHWFEHRDAVLAAGSGAVVPAGFERMVAPYRQVRL